MRTSRRSLAAVAFAIVFALGFAAGIVGSQAARAEAPRTAVCSGTVVDPDKVAAWMNEQLAAGKTDFVNINTARICAW